MTNDPPANFSDPLGQSPPTLRLRKGTQPIVSATLEPASILKNVFIGDYELLNEIARGGMGIVYKAKQWKLNRVVALKVTLADHLATAEDSMRLHVEATAAAKLDHPNIVPIYEVGEAEGRRFFSMAFIEGQSLDQTLGAGPLPPRRAAELLRQVALAVAYAHSHGVIHRDLKPSNILLDVGGQPRVTDFGLAKCAEIDSGLTRVGEVMGTPSYMSPEQAEAKTEVVGPATDVYSLGATLYCLVTGRPPFQAATPLETVKQVVEREPISPRQLNPAVDRDLDTICLRCLQKRPDRRYATATALAEDLQRFLENKPIQARPVGRVEKLVRWGRRNPVVAASIIAASAIFLVAFALVSWSYWELEKALAEARRQGEEAELRRQGERWGIYKAYVGSAANALQLHNVGTARRALENAPEEHRNWEWRHFYTQLDFAEHVLGRPEPIQDAHIIPDGTRVLLRGTDNRITVWDVSARKKLAEFQRSWRERKLSQDGLLFAYTGVGEEKESDIVVRNVADTQVRFVLSGHVGYVGSIFFTRDNARIVTGSEDRTARVWDRRTGKHLQTFRGHQSEVSVLDLSHDGRRAVSGEKGDLTCRVWDMENGTEIARLVGHEKEVISGQFNAAGDRFLTVENFPACTIRLWDPANGELLGVMRGHANQIKYAAFSPDGKTVASCSLDQTVRLWNVADRKPGNMKPMATLEGHNGWVHHVQFSPDGKHLLSASQDQTVRLWEVAAFLPLAVLHGHTADVLRAAFTADGKTIVSGSQDGTVRLWDARAAAINGVFRGHAKWVYGVAFHPDGQCVASSAWDGTVRLWDATTGRQLATMHHDTDTTTVSSVAFHPDGALLASVGRDNSVRLWDVASGRQVKRLHVAHVDAWPDCRVAFHPRGDLLATGNVRGEIYLWQIASTSARDRDWPGPGEPTVLRKQTSQVRDVAFHPNGRWLAWSTEDGSVFVWDLADKEMVTVLKNHSGAAEVLAFSADGKRLASGSTDRTVCLWDTSTWETAAVLKHGAVVYCVAFSPDGTRLTAACADNSIRIWDVAKGEEVAELRGHSQYVHALAFSPDGSRLVSASGDATLRMWDTLSVQQRLGRERGGR